MRKELNTYLVHKETGKIYFFNLEENNTIAHNRIYAHPIDGGERKQLMPKKYHIIPAAALEIDEMIDAMQKQEFHIITDELQNDISDMFFPGVSNGQFDAILEHYRGCGE